MELKEEIRCGLSTTNELNIDAVGIVAPKDIKIDTTFLILIMYIGATNTLRNTHQIVIGIEDLEEMWGIPLYDLMYIIGQLMLCTGYIHGCAYNVVTNCNVCGDSIIIASPYFHHLLWHLVNSAFPAESAYYVFTRTLSDMLIESGNLL